MSKKAKIEIMDDGPLVASNLSSLVGLGGARIETGRKTALCRCGASENKPFCDGSHRRVGFKSGFPSVPPRESEREGEKVIKVLRDGPYEVCGNMELAVSDGSELCGGDPYYLCRCGASENKPFCDGSHKQIGFTDG